LTAIATGVDDREQRDALLTLGCLHGTGDLYGDGLPDIIEHSRPAASA
jgi:EAL domain-containing protein (putative c-di-GMP-specific phosphodiesterase class I)